MQIKLFDFNGDFRCKDDMVPTHSWSWAVTHFSLLHHPCPEVGKFQ